MDVLFRDKVFDVLKWTKALNMSERTIGYSMKCLLSAVGIAVFSVIAGCGGSGELPEGNTGSVSGKVTYKGEAVPDGATIIFINKDNGITASGTIGSNGSYSLQMRDGGNILVGSYQIGVTPPTIEMTPAEEEAVNLTGKMPPVKKWPSIPEKYRIPESSGELFEVKEGSNVFDLDMQG